MIKHLASIVVFSVALLTPHLARACAACFGGADSNLARGFTWGILLLGSLPFLLAGLFITFIVISARKHARHSSTSTR